MSIRGRPTTPFEVVPASGRRVPVIAHVPHASTCIPSEVRAELLIDDEELRGELLRLTDWHTDDLFAWLTNHGVTLFVDRLSRLVFDPERFLDEEHEPAETIGQGVVYTRGTRGQPLRVADEGRRAERVESLYRPYHAALEAILEESLETFGCCTLLDCHSFPSLPLPSELDQAPDRPDICIGTDPTHTPPRLAAAMERAFIAEGFRVKRDSPFSGTFVPSGLYGRDRRVRSVMIEVRRGLYIDETSAQRRPRYGAVKTSVGRAIVRSGVL